jgi:replicative DNA helicase
MTEQIELYIIKCLLESDVFLRTYLPKMTPALFSEKYKPIISSILVYYKKTAAKVPVQVLEDVLLPRACKDDAKALEDSKQVIDTCLSITVPADDIQKFMGEETKKFIKTQTIMNAFVKCVDLVGKDHEQLVSIMEGAFRLNFDESLGHDYFTDLEERLERANIAAEVISTGLPSLDNLIGGGYRRKSLFVFAGPANSGKTLVLNDAATTLANEGYNVLYLTLELTEDYISQRTDAKFSGVSMNQINVDPAEAIRKAIIKRDMLRKEGKKMGTLIYKEYAPNSISCNDIRGLLKTLENKKDFKPDFIVVDYLKLVKPNGKLYADNMYGKLQTVCEELRALGMENNCCIMSASQTGRQSFNAENMGMEDVSDSIGIAQTADVMVMLIRSRENQDIMTLQVSKSRFSKNEGRTVTTINWDEMRLVDANATPKKSTKIVRQQAQNGGDNPQKPKAGPEDDFAGVQL